MTPEFVRNCYDNVREQEDYYRHLHNHEPLPVEEVEEVEDFEEDEEVEAVETVEAVEAVEVQIHTENITTFTFDEFGQIVEEVEDREEVEMVDDDNIHPESAFTFEDDGQIVPPIEKNVEILETPITPESYSCSLCSYKTPSLSRMSRHENSNLHCDVCDEKFHGANMARQLKTHMKTHQPKKSYSCFECKKNFLYASKLNRHMKSVHDSNFARQLDFQPEVEELASIPSIHTDPPTVTQHENDLSASEVPLITEDQSNKRQRKQKLVARTDYPI